MNGIFQNHTAGVIPFLKGGFYFFPRRTNLFDEKLQEPPKGEKTRVMTIAELIAFISQED